MKIQIELTNQEIQGLIIKELESRIGSSLALPDIKIMVRSKQNYREHEFERGEFLVTYEGNI